MARKDRQNKTEKNLPSLVARFVFPGLTASPDTLCWVWNHFENSSLRSVQGGYGTSTPTDSTSKPLPTVNSSWQCEEAIFLGFIIIIIITWRPFRKIALAEQTHRESSWNFCCWRSAASSMMGIEFRHWSTMSLGFQGFLVESPSWPVGKHSTLAMKHWIKHWMFDPLVTSH